MFFIFSWSTLDDWCLNYSTIQLCRFTTNSSWITLWASKGYSLFGQSHTKLITPRTSQISKIFKKLLFQRTFIYIHKKTQTIGFLCFLKTGDSRVETILRLNEISEFSNSYSTTVALNLNPQFQKTINLCRSFSMSSDFSHHPYLVHFGGIFPKCLGRFYTLVRFYHSKLVDFKQGNIHRLVIFFSLITIDLTNKNW